MRKQIIPSKFHILLLVVAVFSCIIAQSDSVKGNVNDKCKKQVLGMFRQVTGASWEKAEGSDGIIFFNDEKAKKENRWTLDEFDEVNPAYRFDALYKNPESLEEKCGGKVEIIGKLFAPTGKIFDFKEATYDTASGKVKFTTVERDGITYEVEVQFYAESVFVKGGFHDGTAKLKASGKNLGTVLMEFPITLWNSH
jgi:hypothetical protein